MLLSIGRLFAIKYKYALKEKEIVWLSDAIL